MKTYTVAELARLAGISVRTLHHYDEIGLPKPAFTGQNRYRYYGRDELLRLQQILIHRELDIPLSNISIANLPVPPEGMEIAHVDVVIRLREKAK